MQSKDISISLMELHVVPQTLGHEISGMRICLFVVCVKGGRWGDTHM